MLTSSHELKIGQFVKSKAGRDKDKIFIVVSIVDEQFVLITDGKLRTLSNPKMKKVKHLARLAFIDEEIQSKIENQMYLNDADFRKSLSKLTSNKEG
ncbi:MAG: hypothetical protein BGO41_15660 [Clostridiales bacterium 38-18]|nr:MAG: hypothetical protein BGO41_15660 [Clostridiales bacterium 38-18]